MVPISVVVQRVIRIGTPWSGLVLRVLIDAFSMAFLPGARFLCGGGAGHVR